MSIRSKLTLTCHFPLCRLLRKPLKPPTEREGKSASNVSNTYQDDEKRIYTGFSQFVHKSEGNKRHPRRAEKPECSSSELCQASLKSDTLRFHAFSLKQFTIINKTRRETRWFVCACVCVCGGALNIRKTYNFCTGIVAKR